MHAEKCPICGGKGKLPTDTTVAEKDCYGCFGKGWVEVTDSVAVPWPWYPPYPPVGPYYTVWTNRESVPTGGFNKPV